MAARGVVSPVAMVLLCLFKEGQFAIIAHHSLHGGWGRRRRGTFAKGIKRMVGWIGSFQKLGMPSTTRSTTTN